MEHIEAEEAGPALKPPIVVFGSPNAVSLVPAGCDARIIGPIDWGILRSVLPPSTTALQLAIRCSNSTLDATTICCFRIVNAVPFVARLLIDSACHDSSNASQVKIGRLHLDLVRVFLNNTPLRQRMGAR